MTRALVAGARGFVGAALVPVLEAQGYDVVRGVRPRFDVDDDASMARALAGVDVAVWLVHGLRAHGDYASWERRVASRFASLCAAAGVRRIVYLGGLEPKDGVSEHLASRLATGRALASAGVDVVELRAGMIVGAKSQSWLIARDACARLPVVFAPPWLNAKQQPVGIDDVVHALARAVDAPAGVYAVPGLDVLTGRDIVERIAALLGRSVPVVSLPLFPRSLAGRLAGWVTRADHDVARALFGGVGLDFTVDGDGIFALMPGYTRTSFDDAAARAIDDDDVPVLASLVERALRAWRPTGPSRS